MIKSKIKIKIRQKKMFQNNTKIIVVRTENLKDISQQNNITK
jgi:hypothetical protein